MDYDELWKRVSSYLIPRIEEEKFNREQAAAYLGVKLDAFDYYVRKLPEERRLRPDLTEKDGRTFKHIFLKSTLDKFKETMRPAGRPKQVHNDE